MAICSGPSTIPTKWSLHPWVVYLSFFSSGIPFSNCLNSHCTYAVAFLSAPDHLDDHQKIPDIQMMLQPPHSAPPLNSYLLHLNVKRDALTLGWKQDKMIKDVSVIHEQINAIHCFSRLHIQYLYKSNILIFVRYNLQTLYFLSPTEEILPMMLSSDQDNHGQGWC